jgi:glycosyltransferase involved in cell wall biosynthesis
MTDSEFVPTPIGSADTNPQDGQRPLWSVMIPTYNCAQYLRQTLESVLQQDPGADQMQIEVVDDCSTSDDPEAVVRSHGRGRVRFYRRPKNGGASANFNTCIERSHGRLIHILHGDDWVAPGFYNAIEKAHQTYPEVNFFHVRSIESDAQGNPHQLSPRISALETPTLDPACMFYSNLMRTPGAVIQRSFYEQHGGFIPALIHVADWEMWIRAISKGGVITLNQLLAFYRTHDGNDTSRLVRSAENLRDYLRLRDHLERCFTDFDSWKFNRMVHGLAQHQVLLFEKLGIEEAIHANRRFLGEFSPAFRIAMRARLLLGTLKRVFTDP